MELHMDGANVMHSTVQTEMYGHLMPSLQHVSVGLCSDVGDPDEMEGNSVNGDTDCDITEEDLSEEEEDVDSGEDDSQIHDLIDDLEVKFRNLVFTKIGEAEGFFDDANTLQHTCVMHSLLAETKNSGDVEGSANPHSSGNQADGPLKTQIIDKKGTCPMVHTATQTDDDIFVTKSSGTLVSNEAICNREESLEPEQARLEIGQLRDVRDSLVAQRQEWEAKRKQIDEKNEEELKKTECKVYEIEEAIEAVETAIEFKNEIIVGQQTRKSIGEDTSLDSNESQLVTRLESLSIEELRRLLCVYFAKVIELRYSSRRLEKNVEHIENLNEQISRRLSREHKLLREMNEEYQTRIRLILSHNNPDSAAYSWYCRMDDQLTAARKKQYDLERSLTALLVRHGYLVNGADYDVKQVVKMLGIESQLAGATSRVPRGEGTAEGGVREQSSSHHSRAWWLKGKRGNDAFPSSRRNGRQLDGHELMRLHRDARLGQGWEREHRHVPPPPVAEVRREKRRLIIQPSSGAPASSNYVHAGPSNHGHHHSHPHHSNHGTNHNHHGYK